jgi:hypothetical protein
VLHLDKAPLPPTPTPNPRQVLHLDKAGEANQSNFVASDGAELETIEP